MKCIGKGYIFWLGGSGMECYLYTYFADALSNCYLPLALIFIKCGPKQPFPILMVYCDFWASQASASNVGSACYDHIGFLT